MNWREIAKRAEGLHTIESFCSVMNINENTGITYIHELKNRGFVETMRGKGGKRLYDITPLKLKPIGFKGFFDILNENSRLKIQKPFEHKVYGKKLTIEEVIIKAIKTQDLRIILASLELFKKINNWSFLYKLAKKDKLERQIGALYTLSKKYFRVKKIDGRILRKMKEAPIHKKYIIPKMKTKDFKEIEKEWGVYIPFNKSDLEKLKVLK